MDEVRTVVEHDKTTWYLGDKIHRDGDQPAIIYSNGRLEWYWLGLLHREGDQPAVIAPERQIWYYHGKKHRDGDKPAMILGNGKKVWLKHDKLHRDGDQPAVIEANGTLGWYQEGQRHRDGDKPAIIEADGTQIWYQHNACHRDGDKPAIVHIDGTLEWYQQGRRHRDHGPAILLYNGIAYYYVNGERQINDVPYNYIRRRIQNNKYKFWFDDLQKLTKIEESQTSTIRAKVPDTDTDIIHEFEVKIAIDVKEKDPGQTEINIRVLTESLEDTCASMEIYNVQKINTFAEISDLYYVNGHQTCDFYRYVKGNIAWGTFMLQLMTKIAIVFNCLYITVSDCSRIPFCGGRTKFSQYNVKNGKSPWYEENDFYTVDALLVYALQDEEDAERYLVRFDKVRQSVIKTHYQYLRDIKECYNYKADKFCSDNVQKEYPDLCKLLSRSENTLAASKKLISLANQGDVNSCNVYKTIESCFKIREEGSRIKFLNPVLELPSIQEYV